MSRTEQIQAAFEKYGSDKAQHGYAEFYARNLPAEPKKILEIGVKDGASINAWREIFPNSQIHGLDLFIEHEIPQIEGAHFWTGNQCDWRILEQLRKIDFDLIIDDGSHNARDQMITFFGLFNGKHYFIEDVHCNTEEFYQQGLPFNLTATSMFRSSYVSGINSFQDCQSPIILIQNAD